MERVGRSEIVLRNHEQETGGQVISNTGSHVVSERTKQKVLTLDMIRVALDLHDSTSSHAAVIRPAKHMFAFPRKSTDITRVKPGNPSYKTDQTLLFAGSGAEGKSICTDEIWQPESRPCNPSSI